LGRLPGSGQFSIQGRLLLPVPRGRAIGPGKRRTLFGPIASLGSGSSGAPRADIRRSSIPSAVSTC
jgi:hypothetical protein